MLGTVFAVSIFLCLAWSLQYIIAKVMPKEKDKGYIKMFLAWFLPAPARILHEQFAGMVIAYIDFVGMNIAGNDVGSHLSKEPLII